MIVTAPDTQLAGQPLTLTCNAVTVRGITSNVGIVWRRDNSVVQRVNNASPTTMNSTSVMYTNIYTISALSTDDDGIGYECSIVIRASQTIRNKDTVTLDVTGKYLKCITVVKYIDLYKYPAVLIQRT